VHRPKQNLDCVTFILTNGPDQKFSTETELRNVDFLPNVIIIIIIMMKKRRNNTKISMIYIIDGFRAIIGILNIVTGN